MRNSNRRKKNNDKKTYATNEVIRCKTKMAPVLEQDTCKEFLVRDSTNSNHNCKNCKNSF